MYAELALPVAVDRTFTYLLPPELEPYAVPGVRAVVPFGGKVLTGVIVGLPDSTAVQGLRPVRDILDPQPVLSPVLLELCRWIAAYYMAPPGEVVRAALPQGFAARSKRLVRLLSDDPAPRIAELEARSPQRARILRILQEGGPRHASELQRRLGVRSIHALLHDLAAAGDVSLEEVLPLPHARPLLKTFVPVADLDPGVLGRFLAGLSSRRRTARAAVERMVELQRAGGDPLPLAEFLARSGSGPALVKELAAAGLLRLERREVPRGTEYGTDELTVGLKLNPAQQAALEQVGGALAAGEHRTFLLHGVTGSGKTQVYIEAIRRTVAAGRAAIVLVPEIALTPQTVRRFRAHFGPAVGVVHSRMSPSERHDVWQRARRGELRVVVGPRSAVFAPLAPLGLVVVDEEHEAAYKQFDQTPRYHARDVAVVRGTIEGAVVLLGSATPSAESYANALSGKYTLLGMPGRIDAVPMPPVHVVDMARERRESYAALRESLPPERRSSLREFRPSPLSRSLQEKIAGRLERGEGVILLQNRRGFAPFVECADCGYTETCDRCSVTMTYHQTRKHLRCHYCGRTRPMPDICPKCNGIALQLLGLGTQKVEAELARLFPQARVLRMDLDTTTRGGSHHRMLEAFGAGKADILLGTQMVAKGLDFPRVTLVGVVSADTQLMMPDFRASERTFQLLTQVAGRAGRSTLAGEVVIQTHQPDHYAIRHARTHDVPAFLEEELAARRELDYPPYSRIVLVEFRGRVEAAVRRRAEEFAARLSDPGAPFMMLGPAPAVIGQVKGEYRWHIVLKNPKQTDPSGARMRQAVRDAVGAEGTSSRAAVARIVDVDPVGLL
jgi:primosomal protein N' (replication factor Y)